MGYVDEYGRPTQYAEYKNDGMHLLRTDDLSGFQDVPVWGQKSGWIRQQTQPQ